MWRLATVPDTQWTLGKRELLLTCNVLLSLLKTYNLMRLVVALEDSQFSSSPSCCSVYLHIFGSFTQVSSEPTIILIVPAYAHLQLGASMLSLPAHRSSGPLYKITAVFSGIKGRMQTSKGGQPFADSWQSSTGSIARMSFQGMATSPEATFWPGSAGSHMDKGGTLNPSQKPWVSEEWGWGLGTQVTVPVCRSEGNFVEFLLSPLHGLWESNSGQ